MIYTDDERAIAGEDFREYVEGENFVYIGLGVIQLSLRDLSEPLRNMLFKRVEADEKKERKT